MFSSRTGPSSGIDLQAPADSMDGIITMETAGPTSREVFMADILHSVCFRVYY